MDEKPVERTEPPEGFGSEDSGGAGQHRGLDALLAYRQGTLPAAEHEAVQEHLSLCPLCTGLLRELRDFETAAAAGDSGPEALRQEAWDSLAARLPALTATPRAAGPALAGGGRGVPRPPWRSPWILAAAAAALLLTIAGLVLRPVFTVRQAQDPVAMVPRDVEVFVAPRFDLRGTETPESAPLRAGGAVNPVRQGSPADPLAVALSLAGQPVYDEYRLELTGRDGKTLWAGRRPGRSVLGDAGTTLSIQGLVPGRYRLRVYGLRADRGALLAEYLLEVGPG